MASLLPKLTRKLHSYKNLYNYSPIRSFSEQGPKKHNPKRDEYEAK